MANTSSPVGWGMILSTEDEEAGSETLPGTDPGVVELLN